MPKSKTEKVVREFITACYEDDCTTPEIRTKLKEDFGIELPDKYIGSYSPACIKYRELYTKTHQKEINEQRRDKIHGLRIKALADIVKAGPILTDVGRDLSIKDKILTYLIEHPGASYLRLEKMLGPDVYSLYLQMQQLKKRGAVEQVNQPNSFSRFYVKNLQAVPYQPPKKETK